MLKQLVWGVCGCLTIGFAAGQASALTLDAAGHVTDWGVTPFADTAPAGVVGVYQNDYAPLNYPHGVGHQPSPGGKTGEKFDLEAMYARRSGNQVQVLLVTSSLFKATANGQTFNLGDLMIDLGGDGSFDLGVVTQAGNANAGLVAGGLYDIDTTRGLQQKPGSYYQNAAIADAIGPWAVLSGDLLGQHDIQTLSFDYAGEAGTWLYEFTFDLTDEQLVQVMHMQFAWGCGNDLITLTLPPGELVPNPEPTTAALGLIGLAGLGLASRRRR